MEKSGQEVWEEVGEMAKLFRSYEPSVREIMRKNAAGEGFSAKDIEFFVHIASDVQIIAGLIEQLRERDVKFY